MFFDSRSSTLVMPKKDESEQALKRRSPRQERSLQKVELMFEAATRLLEAQEPGQISTNAIAKLAGVSIGTLYQYFPDKESLFQALLARELGGLSDRVLEAMKTPPATFSAVNASGDVATSALTPMTASSVWLRQPRAQPSPKAMPARRPRDMPMLSTIRLSGPGVAVSTTAVARKARVWAAVSMARC